MSSTSTTLLQNAIETIDNLNLSTQSMKDDRYKPGNTDGLYVMINKMISDLSSIKAAIKIEEKKISTDIRNHIKNIATATAADPLVTVTGTLAVKSSLNILSTAATLQLNVGLGMNGPANDGATAASSRHETDQASNTLPAVYISKVGSTTIAYSEDAVFGVLASAAEIIKKLKDVQLTATATPAPTTTTIK